MPHFLVFGDTVFCARKITLRGCIRKSLFNIASGSYRVHVQVIQPFFEISVLISTHKLHLNASFAS